MAGTSVMPGKIGETKHTVRMPSSWKVFMADRRRSMLGASSMSSLKASSRVLTDQDTVTFGKVFSRSMSRRTRSDLVVTMISADVPLSCSSSIRVRLYVASCSLGGDHDLCRCPPELFQQHPGALVSSLVLVVAIRDGADDDALPVIFVRIGDARPVFHIQERAPLFRMAGKTLHKRGVTISASVRTAHIWINGKSSHGQPT